MPSVKRRERKKLHIEVDNNPRCLECGEKLETMISMDRVNAGVGGPRPFAFCPVCNPQRGEDVHK